MVLWICELILEGKICLLKSAVVLFEDLKKNFAIVAWIKRFDKDCTDVDICQNNGGNSFYVV